MTAQEAFTRLARVLPEPVLLLTASGVVRAANPACAGVFHTGGLVGRSLASLAVTPPEAVADYLRLCSRNRQFVIGGLRVPGADGAPLPYRCEGALASDPDDPEPLIVIRLRGRSDSAHRFIALTHEIDELKTEIRRRRAVEEALRASDAFSRRILESSADCITIMDGEGRLLSMNGPGQRALGIDDLTPYRETPWVDLWAPGGDRDAARAAVETAAQGGTGKFVGRSAPAGARRWWDVVVTPIPGGDGRPARLLSVSRDVTEQRRLEQERTELLRREQLARASAETANALKDQFLATVSHELRTPLNAILGWARILRGGRLDAAGRARAIETIERNAQMQALLIEDLLDVSRVTTGQLRLQPRPVALGEVVHRALDAVRPAAAGKRLRVELDAGAEPIEVTGDPDRLQQVVWNLLTNAVKFTPEHGRIRVRLAAVPPHARIEVSDSGLGFAPELKPHLFEPFRQADASSTRVHGGLGLGLTITRQLVEAHGGQVLADSPGPGRGAVFTVLLPLESVRTEAAAVEAPEARDAVEPELAGLRVLVVDDQADARELLQIALEQCHADVTMASSVTQALDVLRRQQPDIVLADIGMPEQDGYQLLRAIRGDAKGRHLPVVAVTAYASVTDRDRALRAGFDAHVAKPVDPLELAHTIRAFTTSST